MKFLFDDESFSFETLRAAGFTAYQGSDLGEILATARSIEDGDEPSWHRSWKATAERVAAIGEQALVAGHRVSAREALLRASNYYRTAEFYLRDAPATDPEVTVLSTASRRTFAAAVTLFDSPVEPVAIPYEDTALPGYLFLVDDSGAPRPTVIYTNGYDSTAEESYFVIAAAALRRGYNVLAFDGPGQGSVLREQKIVFRPDWEAVSTPVVDYAVARPEIDADRITLFGYSLGGYLVARAAAHDHRVAALILDDGVLDASVAFEGALPPEVRAWIDEGHDEPANAALAAATTESTQVRWALNNGLWAFGARSYADVIRRSRGYTLEGLTDKIVAPTLILDAENDQFFKGQPQLLAEKLVNAPATLVALGEAEGAGEHCHVGAFHRAHQVMFDWLDTALASA
ncbi:S9 family peptidase [Streptomyces sp. NBC_00083]|uniref:alpha/beta hydrolase family protein n=1 Tax=Streptomyces sp. NBC_00083 TaxID=2975647 RepID=UPI0022539B31|nr:alpha/beta fold hydrolase [Streptomyces sp. NBC_00083]MCX5383841.1 alpha/beta fold hydrolase [Streptomyces sp. NBC_00083]